jgi:2-hydroxyacyl-CoA lyase 1
MMAQQQGIKFIGMRNEQSASYAASAIGYLTRRPAVCLVVSGPGFVHALAGMSNANENAWPLIVVGGSSDSHHESHGAFQEFPQVTVAKHFSKYAARPSSISQIPFFVEKAIRSSIYGRPGSVYLDLAAEMITGNVSLDDIRYLPQCEDSPRPYTSQEKIKEVVDAFSKAKKPLLIVGKGAAYSGAEIELKKLMDKLQFPFIPTRKINLSKSPCFYILYVCIFFLKQWEKVLSMMIQNIVILQQDQRILVFS